MSLVKYLLTLFFCFLSLLVFCQTKDSTVFMKWKLKPNEVLSYKTEMQEIDTANHKDFSFEGLFKSMGVDNNDDHFDEMVKKLNTEIRNANFITHLTEKRKGVINLEFSLIKDKVKDAPTNNEFQKAINQMTSGVMLRGSLYEDGTIESFYTKGDQKNLMALMFELPGRPVKTGDTWSLSINFLSMDQNFTCDSSYRKNTVKLVGVENRNGEHIVNLKYDIVEYVRGAFMSTKTTMKMTYYGIAGFSLEKGRWTIYEGVMSLTSTGIMTSQTAKRISLISE